ncbi:MAG: tetratricopeptide repeat protein [Candidatus Alcyoniella australis]|nr:tetratricopeptide repeat protein [Candidatus Alcyoniella australis]
MGWIEWFNQLNNAVQIVITIAGGLIGLLGIYGVCVGLKSVIITLRHQKRLEGKIDTLLTYKPKPIEVSTTFDLSAIYAPSSFHGREKELDAIEALLQEHRVLTLLGMGGIGKSVLACKAAERVKDRFDAVWGFSFKTDITLQNFLNEIGKRLLGKPAIEGLSEKELKADVLNSLANGRRLLILDNFETVLAAIDNQDQAAIALKDYLSRIGSNTLLMFTSRRHPVGLDDEKTIKVVSPERQTAIDILCSALGDRQQDYSDEQLDGIATKLADHPLSCRLIGGFLARSPLDAQDAVEQVLDLLPQARVETEQENQRSLDDSLDLSLRNLPADELRMLRACSVFKGEFVSEAGAIMAVLIKDDQPQTDYANELLFSLHQRSLLENGSVARYPAVKTYAFHSLVRQTLQRKLDPESHVKQLQLLGNYADMLSEYIAQKQGIVPTDWLVSVQQMLPDLVRGARSLGKGGAAALGNLAIMLQNQGEYLEAIRMHEECRQIFKKADDKRDEAVALHQIGIINQKRGDLDAALEQYQQAQEIFDELGAKMEQAAVLHQIGRIHQDRGDLDAALEHYQRSIKIKREIGNKAGIASSLHQIGRIHQLRGDLDAALEQYQQSMKIKREIGDKAGEALTTEAIGLVRKDQGRIEEAIKLVEQAIQAYQQIGAKAEVARAQRNLDRMRGML